MLSHRRDGGGATVFICVAEGTLSKAEEARLNEELKDLGGHVLVNGRDNHFFDANTVVQYYESVLGPAFRAKRKQLGIGDDVKRWKGLCIPDACTSNRDRQFLAIRQQWEEQHNVKADGVITEPEPHVYMYMHMYMHLCTLVGKPVATHQHT